MKAIYKTLLAAAVATPLFTGCIEDIEPTDIITETQLQSSVKATEALVWAIPGHFNQIGTVSLDQHYDFGYPSILHIRDVMTEDMYVRDAGGYNWFSSWSSVRYTLGQDYLVCQYTWNYMYEQILTANNTIGAIDREKAGEEASLAFYLGTALANRAMVYLDAARMYEVLPNEANPECLSPEGNNILGLTMPIVTEETTEEQYADNPRVPHADMVAFIEKDLIDAVEYFGKGMARPDKTLPNLACAYGLLARLCLWDASYIEEIDGDAAASKARYAEAAKYARLAISNSGATPLTQDQWLSTTSGFNDLSVSSWMWGSQYVTEDDAVQAGGIRTFASFMSPEQVFGYCAPAQGAFPEIGASVYNRINDRDFRKLSFVAPEGSALADRVVYLDKEFAEENFDGPYIAVKFRPGQGNMDDYLVGSCTAVPLMRVEEMYFIEAEATAHSDAAAGKKLLTDFMTTYRYPTYSTNAADADAVIEEIIFQKRVELWGEGRTFFDIKRLNYSVTRWYDGTNFEAGLDTYNTNGRPAWMNFVIVRQESDNNSAILGYNTPTPAGYYVANQ